MKLVITYDEIKAFYDLEKSVTNRILDTFGLMDSKIEEEVEKAKKDINSKTAAIGIESNKIQKIVTIEINPEFVKDLLNVSKSYLVGLNSAMTTLFGKTDNMFIKLFEKYETSSARALREKDENLKRLEQIEREAESLRKSLGIEDTNM